MDITFVTQEGKFNYRVCAVILHNQKLLAMKDVRAPYYYLPGGRVAMGETAEQAVLREVQEELGVEGKILRPLWLNQAFFTEDVEKTKFHELCLYFLIDVSDTELMLKGERFTTAEGEKTHEFAWLDFGRLKEEYLYPLFIKEEIFQLPDALTLRTEWN